MMTILQGLKIVLCAIIYIVAVLWLTLWIIPMLVCHFLFLDRVGNIMGVVASGPLVLAYALMEKDEHACR